MLIPLKQFICDECGEIINSPGEGYVEWEEGIDQDGQFFAKGFRIVHHLPKSPYKNSSHRGCYKYEGSLHRSDIDLEHFLDDSHQLLYAFLSSGHFLDPDGMVKNKIEDFVEFVDFAKRLTVPFYEEARMYIGQAIGDPDFNNNNSVDLYTEETLKKIVEKYS